jgi:hypothetical protein
MVNSHEQKHQRYDKYLVARGPWSERPGGSLASGDLYKDTGRGGLEFSYDGTRWLAVQKDYLAGIPRAAQPLPQATNYLDFPLPDDLEGSGGYYVTGLALDMQPQTAQGAVFYTAVLLYTTDGTNYITVTPTANSTTAGMTVATTAYRLKPTLTAFVLPNTARNLAVQLTPTGAAGTLYVTASLTYRLIGV